MSIELHPCRETLSKSSNDWKVRIEALQMLRSLLLAGAANYDEMYNALRTLDVPFQASFPLLSYFDYEELFTRWRFQFMNLEIFSIVLSRALIMSLMVYILTDTHSLFGFGSSNESKPIF